MAVLNKIKRALRGEVKLTTAAREAWRRGFVSLQQRNERARVLGNKQKPADLWDRRMSPEKWLCHFRADRDAKFFRGFTDRASANFYRTHFLTQAKDLIASADLIVNEH